MRTNFNQHSLTSNASLIRQINFARILSLLRHHPGLTRAEIARRTDLPRSTVTLITADLIATGLVQEGQEVASGTEGGRPGIELELDPEGAAFIGVAIGAETIRVVELNLAAQVTDRVQVPITKTDPASVTKQVVALIEQVWQANAQSKERTRGIGITIPGSLNREGVILHAPRLGWQNVDLRSYLDLHLDVPLFIENDANAGAMGEMYLGGSTLKHSLLYLFLDVGIGAGMVLNNRLLRGAGGTACEIAELMIDSRSVDLPDGKLSGTLEALCSRTGLLNTYAQQCGERIDFKTLLDRLQQSETTAQTVVNGWGRCLSGGLRGLVGILNPERIVFGGQLTALLPYVQDQIDERLRNCLPDGSGYGFDRACRFRLAISQFGDNAAAIGGAVLVYRSLFQMPDLLLLQP